MQKNSFTEGPILKPLLMFTLPIIASMFLQCAYGAVDLIIIGKYASNADVSAVGTASLLIVCITNFITGLSTGMTVVIGNRIGAGDPKKASRCVGASIMFFIALSIGLTAVLMLLSAPISNALNVLPEAINSYNAYINICLIGLICIVGYNVSSAIFNSIGDSRTPLICVGIACIINIIGDIYLVKKLGMGAKGAAIATVVAQACSVVFSALILMKRKTVLIRKEIKLRFNREDISEVVKTGLPIGTQASLTTISFLTLVSSINSLGMIFSSGYAVGMKVTTFVSIPIKAFCSSLAAFVAHNIGAGRIDRADKALKLGMLSSFTIGVLLFIVFFIFAKPCAFIFTTDDVVASAAAEYLRGFAFDNFVGSFTFSMVGYFNGRKKTKWVMFQSLFCAFCVRVPMAIIIKNMANPTMFLFGLVAPAASSAGLILNIFFYRYVKKKDLSV